MFYEDLTIEMTRDKEVMLRLLRSQDRYLFSANLCTSLSQIDPTDSKALIMVKTPRCGFPLHDFNMPNKQEVAWIAWATGLLSDQGFSDVTQYHLDASHLCDCPFCMNSLDICFENNSQNSSRRTRHASARQGSRNDLIHPSAGWPTAVKCDMVAASLPLTTRLGLLSVEDEGWECGQCDFTASDLSEYYKHCHVKIYAATEQFRFERAMAAASIN